MKHVDTLQGPEKTFDLEKNVLNDQGMGIRCRSLALFSVRGWLESISMMKITLRS